MATDFPNTGSLNPGDSFTDPNTGITYFWYPPVWKTDFVPNTSADTRYVEVAGDTMTGSLALNDKITLDATDGKANFEGDVTVATDKITLAAIDGSASFAGAINANSEIVLQRPSNDYAVQLVPAADGQKQSYLQSKGPSNGADSDLAIFTSELSFRLGDYVSSSQNAGLKFNLNETTARYYTAVEVGDVFPNAASITLSQNGSAEFKGDVAIGDSDAAFSTLADVVNRLSEELQTQYATDIAALNLTTAFTGDPETLPTDINTNLRDALVRVTTAGKINLNSDGTAEFKGDVSIDNDNSQLYLGQYRDYRYNEYTHFINARRQIAYNTAGEILGFEIGPSNSDAFAGGDFDRFGIKYKNPGKFVIAGRKRTETDFNDIITITENGAEFAGDVQMASQNGGPLAGFRNHIINGDFRIAQRGTSITIPGGAPASYTLDRWVGSAGDTVSQNYTSDTLCLQTTGTWVASSVEIDVFNNSAVPAEFSLGTQWTLSYYADKPPGNSLSTLITFREKVVNAASTVDVSNNVPVPTATGKSIGNLNQYSTTFTIDNFTRADSRCLSFHLEGNSAGVNFAYVQLEPGPVATPFEHRPIGIELALCQRYYLNLNESTIRFPVIQSSNSTSLIFNVPTPVPMRANPSVVGTCSKYSVPTGSNLGSGTCSGSLRGLSASIVRVEGSGSFTASDTPCGGIVNGALDAEL